MSTLLFLARLLGKTVVFCAAVVTLLMLGGIALQVIVPVAMLLGFLLVMKGTWRVLTPCRCRRQKETVPAQSLR